MSWNSVQMPNLLAAMAECDRLGADAFRTRYGPFRPARNLRMYYPGRKGRGYEARPLLAAAHADRFPHARKMVPRDFENNDAHEFLIKRFGFKKREI